MFLQTAVCGQACHGDHDVSSYKHNGNNFTFVFQAGVKTHYVEMGSGPPVLFCHGFPECWYSWRFQVSHVLSLTCQNGLQSVLTCLFSGSSQPWLQQGSGPWLWTWRDTESPQHLLVSKHHKYLTQCFDILLSIIYVKFADSQIVRSILWIIFARYKL